MIRTLLMGLICAGSLAPSPLKAMEEKTHFKADTSPSHQTHLIEDEWRYHLNDPSNVKQLMTKIVELKNSASIFRFEFSSSTGSPENNEPTFLTPYLNHLIQHIDLFAITCRGVFLSNSTCSFIFLIEDKDTDKSDTISIKMDLEKPWQKSTQDSILSLLQKFHVCPFKKIN